MAELKNIKNNHDKLIELVMNYKKENLALHKDIANITIECNKLLRESK